MFVSQVLRSQFLVAVAIGLVQPPVVKKEVVAVAHVDYMKTRTLRQRPDTWFVRSLDWWWN